MKKIHIIISFIALAILSISACKKTDTYKTDSLTDYMQLQPGKSVTYRLDSTNFTNYGTAVTITSYVVKDIIDTLFNDNLGRPSWRVIRYITDTNQSAPGVNNETYMITPTLQTVEVTENNLRFIKLSLPLDNGFSWLGNSYIGTTSPPNPDTDPDFNYLSGWNYTYDSIGVPYTVLEGTIPNTLIVRQQDETVGDSTNRLTYSERNYSVEVYAKGIGLIYKDFLHQENQPPNGSHPVPYIAGYGIRLNMIGHE